MKLQESAKSAIYRAPVLQRLMAPKYPYKINPGQLAAMLGFIDTTRGSGALVAEIGVAQGDTSIFLLEHLATTDDDRTLHLFDTFNGFTEDSIDHEVQARQKSRSDYDAFRYGDERIFQRNIRKAGYHNFRTIKGDAARFDWSAVGPIGAVLLDIDLYRPTIDVLNAVYPRLVPGGGIVLDDCRAGTPWDGSLQAYEEFISAHGLPFERVGGKGAVIRAA
ncbi:TylF/MycF/NovP-related O-methyltransferase [Mycolicibacterium canariasense]|nr:TylF/MycF/NovP-related O-methyltransferase [Mycolicibacterium canariasense]MCV7212063.1 class I SAM-dependent methyltransferase [Mycolicibacterium canariasense]